MKTEPSQANIFELVPHRPPILMIDRLLTYEGDKGSTEYRVDESNPLLDAKGILHPLALVEVMAQAFAACNGYEVKIGLHRRIHGMIAGIQAFEVFQNVRVGDRLITEIHKVNEVGAFGFLEGKIFRGDDPIATVSMKVWSSDHLPE